MIAGLAARARSLWRGLTRRSDVEAEMHEEFRFHVDARVEDLVRAGFSRPEATRRASIEFGNFERYKDEARASRGLRPFDELAFSWLDVRLAFRMLRRYPGLTVVGGLAMAFGIAAGVVGFEVLTQLASPRLTLDEGDRIVGLQHWVVEDSRVEPPLLSDFAAWRDELESVENVAAFRSVGRNLIVDGRAESIDVAEISASAFSVARVPPLLGRWLDAADEAPGATPVIAIGHDAWQSRFGGDPNVVGRLVRLGRVQATIVGVMPAGFAFPVAHDFWVPLQTSDGRSPARRGARPRRVRSARGRRQHRAGAGRACDDRRTRRRACGRSHARSTNSSLYARDLRAGRRFLDRGRVRQRFHADADGPRLLERCAPAVRTCGDARGGARAQERPRCRPRSARDAVSCRVARARRARDGHRPWRCAIRAPIVRGAHGGGQSLPAGSRSGSKTRCHRRRSLTAARLLCSPRSSRVRCLRSWSPAATTAHVSANSRQAAQQRRGSAACGRR